MVYGVDDWELGRALSLFAGKIDAEISGLAGFAVLHRLEEILGRDVRRKNVLVINTGNGIPNFRATPRAGSAQSKKERVALLSIRQASDLLGVHPNTLRLWEAKGLIHAIRVGSRKDRRYQGDEIDRLLAGQESAEKGYAFHNGKKAFEKIFDRLGSTLSKEDFYWTFAFDSEYADSDVRAILKRLHGTLEKKGIEDRALCCKAAAPSLRQTFIGNKNISIRVAKGDVPTGVIVLRDRVIHLIWSEEPAAYELFNAEAVRQYHNLFVGTWAQSGPVKKDK